MSPLDTLRKMFPDIAEAEMISETSTPSFNDGGNHVTNTWKIADKHYRTLYNDWSVDHPSTTCQLLSWVDLPWTRLALSLGYLPCDVETQAREVLIKVEGRIHRLKDAEKKEWLGVIERKELHDIFQEKC